MSQTKTSLLTKEQQEQGRLILLAEFSKSMPGLTWQWASIFSLDGVFRVLPSEDVVGKVSYVANPEHPNRRTRTSLGRFLVKKCGIGDSGILRMTIERAVSAVSVIYPQDSQFEILRGDDLLKAYADQVGGGSCMSGRCSVRQGQLSLYARNEDKVGLLVWRKTVARALFWTLDDGRRYVDRIYSGNFAASRVYDEYLSQCGIEGCKWGRQLRDAVVTLEYLYSPPPYSDSFYLRGNKLLMNCPLCTECGCQELPCVMKENALRYDNNVCSNCVSRRKICPVCGEPMWKRSVTSYIYMGKRCCINCVKSGKVVLCWRCKEYVLAADFRNDISICKKCCPSFLNLKESSSV